MTHSFYAYIDEAGDEGFGKLRKPKQTGQSRWLALGAILVDTSSEQQIPKWRDEALDILKNRSKRDLHFRNMKHDQRVVIAQYFADKPIGCCVVLSNKVTLRPNTSPETQTISI